MPLLSAASLSMHFTGPLLLDGVSVSVEKGRRVGVIGPNGAGKSTLLKLLDGQLEPTGGAVVRQKGVRVAYQAQELQVDTGRTVLVGPSSEALAEVGLGQLVEHAGRGTGTRGVDLARKGPGGLMGSPLEPLPGQEPQGLLVGMRGAGPAPTTTEQAGEPGDQHDAGRGHEERPLDQLRVELPVHESLAGVLPLARGPLASAPPGLRVDDSWISSNHPSCVAAAGGPPGGPLSGAPE